MKQLINWCLACVAMFAQIGAKANVRLPAILSSNMVLQQQSDVKLWGWGNPGEPVIITTSWNNKTDSTKVDGNAKWQLKFPTPNAGGPYTITMKGYNTIELTDVLIGEVWVCSGQSNMEMNYTWGLPQMKEDITVAKNSRIHFFSIPKTTAVTPQENGGGSWEQCDSITVKFFSAVAYYFGKKLNADLNVPIGLIHASWGGTPAEAWTPAEEVNNDNALKQAALKLKPSGGWPITPGYAYNGMIAPVVNYKIAGVIWYQGESNTGTANTYHSLFSTMIKSWRNKWNMEMPFYYVQLAPFTYGNRNIGASLREAQHQTLVVSKTGMVVTTDLADDTTDIHPKNKRDVGLRLANLALLKTYNKNITGALSPAYKNMTVKGSRITINFDNAETGLTQKGKAIAGLYIAGSDKIFYPADGNITAQTLVVWSKSVQQPVAVRYAFSNTAAGNIFSKEGLPLSPFRTDNWEVDTSSIK
jgi:sialate O-acetylesterase